MKLLEVISFKNGNLQKVNPDNFKILNKYNWYLRLPNNKFLKKLIILIYLKFLRKILLLFYVISKTSVSFKDPEKKKNIIFDQTLSYLSVFFLKKNFFILQTRVEHINKIYITKKIIFFLVKNYFKNSLKINYLIILIKIINPKNIITFVDNSIDFFIISKKLNNTNINFFAIQNASRNDISPEIKKKRYINNYLIFSEFEKKLFKKKLKIKNFIQIGSLKAEIAKKKFLNKNLKKNYYDICFISEPDFIYGDLVTSNNNKNLLLAMDHAINFAKKYKKKIIILGKSDINNVDEQNKENEFYKDIIRKYNLKITYNNKQKFENYKILIESKIIVGCTSSLLREAFAFNKKVLCCKYIKKTTFPSTGICTLTNKSYLKFETRMKKIFDMPYKNYIKQVNNLKNLYSKKIDTIQYLSSKFN